LTEGGLRSYTFAVALWLEDKLMDIQAHPTTAAKTIDQYYK
jgi:hypothetical protein